MIERKWWAALLAVAGVGMASLASAPAALAGPTPHMRVAYKFGIVGLARGQTARLNVVCSDPEWCPSDPSAAPVVVELAFWNGDGRVLGPAGTPTRVRVRLMPDRGVFLHLDLGDLGIDGDGLDIRAIVTIDNPNIRAPRGGIDNPNIRALLGVDSPDIVPTLELTDTETGRTQVVLAPGSTRFFKEVDPMPVD